MVVTFIHVGQPFDALRLLMACGRQTKTDISQITESLQTERRMALSKRSAPAWLKIYFTAGLTKNES